MPDRGRPPSEESRRIELLCELQALQAESMQLEIRKARITREVTATFAGAMPR